MTIATLNQWSKRSSAEELFQRVHDASESFVKLKTLASRPKPEVMDVLLTKYDRAEATDTWGGSELSAGENGDFMHFDCRLTAFGKRVYDAGRAAKRRR